MGLYLSKITLTPFNTGSTLHSVDFAHAPLRGPETFQPIEDFRSRWVRELVVESGLTELGGLVKSVKRCVSHSANWADPQDQELETLWLAPG